MDYTAQMPLYIIHTQKNNERLLWKFIEHTPQNKKDLTLMTLTSQGSL